jgi:glycosyltransferase involved in cell wall biosynthesis
VKEWVRVVNTLDMPEIALPSGKKIAFQDHQAMVDPPTLFEICANAFAFKFLRPDPVEEFDPSTWTRKRRLLQWDGGNSSAISFGHVTLKMIEALEREGVEVFVTRTGAPHLRVENVEPEIRAIVERQAPYTTWAVRYAKTDLDWMLPATRRIRFTMWEWDSVPAHWIENINRYNHLLVVPSKQQAALFKGQGVTIPISIVGHGVDPDVYRYRKPERRPFFTFGTMGYLNYRKGIDVLVKAFSDEFAKQDDVRLVLKSSNTTHEALPPPTPHVEILTGFYSQEQIADLLASFDVGVFPARGEGFGMGGLEAMAVGRTVICTGWGGMADYLNPAYNYALDYRIEKPLMEWPPSFGQGYRPSWAEPSYQHLRNLMRHCYQRRGEVRTKGLAASRWVHRRWTWARAAKQLIQAIDDLTGIAKKRPTPRRAVKGRRRPRS